MNVTAGGKPLWALLDQKDWEVLQAAVGIRDETAYSTHHKHPALSESTYHSHNDGKTPHTHAMILSMSTAPLKIEVDDDNV